MMIASLMKLAHTKPVLEANVGIPADRKQPLVARHLCYTFAPFTLLSSTYHTKSWRFARSFYDWLELRDPL